MREKPTVQIIKWFIDGDKMFGDVVDHPEHKSGTFVQTSVIISRRGTMVETKNTIYKLVGEESKW